MEKQQDKIYAEIQGKVDKFNSTGKGTYKVEVLVDKLPGTADVLERLEKKQVTITAVEGDIATYYTLNHDPGQTDMDLIKYPVPIADEDGKLEVEVLPGTILKAMADIQLEGVSKFLEKDQMIQVSVTSISIITTTDGLNIGNSQWHKLGFDPAYQVQPKPICVDGDLKVKLFDGMELEALENICSRDEEKAETAFVLIPKGEPLVVESFDEETIVVSIESKSEEENLHYALTLDWHKLGWVSNHPDGPAQNPAAETSNDDEPNTTPLNEDDPTVLSFEDINKGDVLTNPEEWKDYPANVIFVVEGIDKNKGTAIFQETLKPGGTLNDYIGDGDPFEVDVDGVQTFFTKV